MQILLQLKKSKIKSIFRETVLFFLEIYLITQ